jgi:hypothetical protein
MLDKVAAVYRSTGRLFGGWEIEGRLRLGDALVLVLACRRQLGFE